MGMNAGDNGGQSIRLDWKIFALKNRIVFYTLNLLFLLPALQKSGSLAGLAAAVVLLIILLVISMRSGGNSEPASAQIPVLLFFDGLILFAWHGEALLAGFHTDQLEQMTWSYMQQRPLCLVLAGIGLLLGLLGLWRRYFWLVSLSGAALGSAVILLFWSSGSLRNFRLFANGEKVIAAFLVCAFIWTLFSRVAQFAAPEKWGLNVFLSILLLCGIAALHLLEPQYVQSLAAGLLGVLLTWKQVAVACVLLLIGCAITAMDKGAEGVSFDFLTLLACALFIFAAKFLSCTYFIGSRLFFLLLPAGMLWCLKNAATDRTTLGLSPLCYMSVQAGILLVCAKALQMGLHLNVALAAVTGWALRLRWIQEKPESFQDFFCRTLIAFFAAEALVWQWRMRFSREGVLLIAVVFAMAMGGLLLTGLPHPEGVRAPGSVRIWVCACAGILCLLSMIPTLWIRAEVRGDESYIEVKALTGAEARKISCCWKDWRGQVIEETELKEPKAVLPVRGDLLTVTAADEKGIRSSRDFWVPVRSSLF